MTVTRDTVGPFERVRWVNDETGEQRTAWFCDRIAAIRFRIDVRTAIDNDEPVHALFDWHRSTVLRIATVATVAAIGAIGAIGAALIAWDLIA